MQRNKFLKKTILALLLCGALTVGENAYTSLSIPYTKEDLTNTKSFVTTLDEIENTNPITFENQELLSYLNASLGYQIDSSNIKNITKLEINTKLTDSNLSDLKYFINLEELTIIDNEVDLSALTYNQSLIDLKLINSKVTNTNLLPNTIQYLTMYNTIVEDNLLYLPYDISSLVLYQTGFTNIKPKSTKNLYYFYLDSNIAKVDISFLKKCPLLISATIHTCPNINNPEVLTKLPFGCQVHLDDYAPIWLTKNQYDKIQSVESEYDLASEINDLDKLANYLVPDKTVDDSTKLRAIAHYIIRSLKYSKAIIDKSEDADTIAEELNKYPIKYALDVNDSYDEVCINYACLFQALANRVGLDSTQLMSEKHTWNLINGHYLDLTSLDEGIFVMENNERLSLEGILDMDLDIPDSFYYVSDVTNPGYQEIYHFHEQIPVDENIGYVKKEKKESFELYYQISKNLLISFVFFYLLFAIKGFYYNHHYDEIEKDIEERLGKHR